MVSLCRGREAGGGGVTETGGQCVWLNRTKAWSEGRCGRRGRACGLDGGEYVESLNA